MTTETELKDDIRQFTGYTSEQVLSTDGLDTAYRTAQRHIRVQKDLEANFDWFDPEEPQREEALFWWTCLFSKVQTGELDSGDFQAGAIRQKEILAKDDNQITTWYRNATKSMESINASGIFQSSAPIRNDRQYESEDFTTGDSVAGSGSDFDL